MTENKRYEFTGELYIGPRSGYYIDFPWDVPAEFGTAKQVKVKVWFDGHFERKSLLPKGNGKHWLSVAQNVRLAIGKSDGDKVNIVLEQDFDPRTVQLPDDLEWLLDNEPEMKTRFQKTGYSAQKFFTDWIVQAREPDIRVKRINRLFEWLQQHRTGRSVSPFINEDSD